MAIIIPPKHVQLTLVLDGKDESFVELLRGPKGDKGDRGNDANNQEVARILASDYASVTKGPRGDKGDKGDSIQGEKGDPGRKGDPGLKGDKGNDGEPVKWSEEEIRKLIKKVLAGL